MIYSRIFLLSHHFKPGTVIGSSEDEFTKMNRTFYKILKGLSSSVWHRVGVNMNHAKQSMKKVVVEFELYGVPEGRNYFG